MDPPGDLLFPLAVCWSLALTELTLVTMSGEMRTLSVEEDGGDSLSLPASQEEGGSLSDLLAVLCVPGSPSEPAK